MMIIHPKKSQELISENTSSFQKELFELKEKVLHPYKIGETSIGYPGRRNEQNEKNPFNTSVEDVFKISNGSINRADAAIFLEICSTNSLNPLAVLSLMKKESSFIKKTEGDLNLGYAYGYFQFNLGTSTEILESFNPPIKNKSDLVWVCRSMKGQMELFIHFINHKWKKPMVSALQSENPDWAIIATYHNGAHYEDDYINGENGIKTNYYNFQGKLQNLNTHQIARLQEKSQKPFKKEEIKKFGTEYEITNSLSQKEKAISSIVDKANEIASKKFFGEDAWNKGASLLQKNSKNRNMLAYRIEDQVGNIQIGDTVCMGKDKDGDVWMRILRQGKIRWVTLKKDELLGTNEDDLLFFRIQNIAQNHPRSTIQELKDNMADVLERHFGSYKPKTTDAFHLEKDFHGLILSFTREGETVTTRPLKANGKWNEGNFTTQKQPEKTKNKTYTVKKGDTLASIAREIYQISDDTYPKNEIEKIKRENNLKTTTLTRGQIITIPK